MLRAQRKTKVGYISSNRCWCNVGLNNILSRKKLSIHESQFRNSFKTRLLLETRVIKKMKAIDPRKLKEKLTPAQRFRGYEPSCTEATSFKRYNRIHIPFHFLIMIQPTHSTIYQYNEPSKHIFRTAAKSSSRQRSMPWKMRQKQQILRQIESIILNHPQNQNDMWDCYTQTSRRPKGVPKWETARLRETMEA